MGIDGLSKLLAHRSARAVRTNEIGAYFGRRIAVDASCVIYQFIIAMKRFNESGHGQELTDNQGEITSHLQGIWYRTIRMIGAGIKPVYVFDGAPPKLKERELLQRRQRAEDATNQFAAAKEAGDIETMVRMSKRSVRVSKEQTEECKKLLSLMGLPVIQAPCEAEAQCVELCKAGKTWAVATEDMDALTFGAPVMLRHLSSTATHGTDRGTGSVIEYHIDEVLQGLGLTQKELIDLSILLGCDYTSKIPGIGPVRAYEGIQQYRTIEAFIESLGTKYTGDDSFDFQAARDLFYSPVVTPASDIEIEFRDPDVEGLRSFLIGDKGFSEERIEKGIARLLSARSVKTQSRLDAFFTIKRNLVPSAHPLDVKKPEKKGRREDTTTLPTGKFQKSHFTGGKKGVKKT